MPGGAGTGTFSAASSSESGPRDACDGARTGASTRCEIPRRRRLSAGGGGAVLGALWQQGGPGGGHHIVNLDNPPSPGPAGAAAPPEAGMRQDPSPTVSGQPTLRDPRGDDRLIEELADLLAAALVADLQRQKNDTDSPALSEAMVVSPPGKRP